MICHGSAKLLCCDAGAKDRTAVDAAPCVGCGARSAKAGVVMPTTCDGCAEQCGDAALCTECRGSRAYTCPACSRAESCGLGSPLGGWVASWLRWFYAAVDKDADVALEPEDGEERTALAR